MEQNKNELVKECNKKIADYKTKWEEFTRSAKSKLEQIRDSNIEEAELEELDEMSNSITEIVNTQLKMTRQGEELLSWVVLNNLKNSLNPKDLKNLQACIGANELPSLDNLNDFPNFEKSLEEVEKTQVGVEKEGFEM